MAEFFDVMVEMRRMHDNYDDCNDGCPLCNKGFCDKPWCEVSEEDIKEAEKIIMEWSKEHPKVVEEYPTWGEWLEKQGVVKLVQEDGAPYYALLCEIEDPISPDIAQLLGLEPVPIVHGDCGATNKVDARKMLGLQPKEITC